MDRYLQYTHIELAEDPSFIKWVRGSKSDDDLDWDKWLSQHPQKKSDVDNAVLLVKGMRFENEEVSQSREDNLWSKINSEIQTEGTVSPQANNGRGKIIRLLSYGAVAAIALLLIFVNIGSEYDTTVDTSFANFESVTLPDQSIVQMNADTKLEYNVENWNAERTLRLSGEAFFSVEKGAKFTVVTDYGEVSVLGTSFNINTRNNQLNVICKTGKVAVTSSSKETILTADQSVNVKENKHEFKNKLDMNSDRSKWIDGTYMYDGAALSFVISDLERLYDIKINIDDDLTKSEYTGSFVIGNLNSSLSEVLWPLGYTFNINGKNVDISKK